MRATLLKFVVSPSLSNGIVMAIGGVAIGGANLILAKLLSKDAFGSVVLFQAIASLGIGFAPLGVDNLIVRREIELNRQLLTGIVIVACAFSVLFAGSDYLFGNKKTSVDDALWFGLACLGGGIANLTAASERSKQKFWRAQLILQAPYLCFFLLSVLLLFFESPTRQLGVAAFVLAQLLSATVGFAVSEKNYPRQPRKISAGLWLRAVSFLGVLASVMVLSQLERLVAARYLGLEALATFGVAATLILSPYRALATGISFTLMPRLVGNPSGSSSRELLVQELFVAVALGTLGGMILFLLAPPLINLIYEDKFHVSPILLICLIVAGVLRTAYGFVSAIIGAIGDTRMLRRFNLYGWLGTGLAGVAAVLMSSFGLSGVVLGVSLGWLIRISAGLILIRE